MMKFSPYLTFDGQCEAAFKFYEDCFGGKIEMMMRYGESPMADQSPGDFRNKIMHATLSVKNQNLQGADVPPNRYEEPQGFFVAISIESLEEARGVFTALAEKGSVQMPLQQTFWSKGFGMLVDKFGTPWMINCSSS